jgi:hypothetical protein
MNIIKFFHLNRRHVASTYLVFLMSIVALTAGWILKSVVDNQYQPFTDKGVIAAIPSKWSVKSGLASEELVFSTNPPLDLNFHFDVLLLPVIPGGKITDLVISRNYSAGQSMHFYRVIDQKTTQSQGRSAYQVNYAYIKTDTPTTIPIVMKGTNFYISYPEKILMVTFENTEDLYEESLPKFFTFLEKITYKAGG